MLTGSLKINNEERKEGTIGKETMSNIGNFIKGQYEKIPEDTREDFEQGVSDAATGIQSWNKQLREDNYWGGIGPLDPFIGAANVYNAVATPIKKELSIKTGLAPSVIDTGEVALDLLTPGIPLGAKKAQKIVNEVFDNIPSGKVYAAGPNPNQLKFFDLPMDPAGKEAFRVFSESVAKKSGYESMAEFKKNVLNKWPQKDQDQLFRQLWEGQGEGYIEHLTQKAGHMDWYWNMKGRDRNAVDNVRILFNDNLKNLKDTVEKIVHGQVMPNGTFKKGVGWQGKDFKNRLIVSFEDPQRKIKKAYLKQNPGDIIIKRAGNDQIIGNLGQYLDTLYPQDPLLKKVFEEGVSKLGLTPAQFRKQVLTERINIIIENSHTLPKNATKRKRYIKQFIDDDMVDLTEQYPFLRSRKSITEAMDTPGSGVTEADYNLRGQGKNPIPPLGDPKFQKGGPFKDVTKTEQFNPRQILLDIFGPDE